MNYNANILFIGGNKIHYNIFKVIRKEYLNTKIAGYKNNIFNKSLIKKADVIVLPTLPQNNGNIIADYKNLIPTDVLDVSNKTIICGINNGIKTRSEVIEYCKKEEFKILNAIPTAEAAVNIAVQSTKSTLFNSNILVIGYGAIGKRLANILTSYGANVTVSARHEKDFAMLKSNNINYINTYSVKNFKKYNIIFNTVPKNIINTESISKNCLYIELASNPYGIDFLKQYKFNKILASSLPSKYSENYAVKIISKTILDTLKVLDYE